MSVENEDQELLEGFLTETAELLEKLDDDLVTLEKTPSDKELLNRIFRSIHTVKGASSFLGFELLVKVTHKTEDVLNRLRKEELVVNPEIMDVVLEAVDLVKLLVSDVKAGDKQEREIRATIGKLLPLLSENAVEATVLSVAPPAAEPTIVAAQRQKTAVGKKDANAPSRRVAAKAKEPPSEIDQVESAPMAVTKLPLAVKESGTRGDEFGDKSTVRVDVKRLDDLMNQMGELVLERNRMIQLNTDYQGETNMASFGEEFGKLSKRLNFVTSELQLQVLKMRMIPVGNIFKKFPRIVRTMSRDLGKEVSLQIHGEETELDRSLVDEIGDPLIHLIRNALDHGVESPVERNDAGKPREGVVVLAARHEGNQIVISISDDGRGIDPGRLAKKALAKGIISDEQLANMGEQDILELIFLPGFSTKEQATDLSGRGVGMDVVRTNVKRLNGIIEIRNKPGHGAEFILKLPLTLAIIQSLLVEAAGEIYSLPMSAVIETLRVTPQDFHTIGGQEVLKRTQSVLPLLRLQDVFGIEGAAGLASSYCYVVVVGAAEKRLGLVVSRLLGQQEIAIKSLGRYLAKVPGIAGSTILGDGRVTLIVDPAKLMECSRLGTTAGRLVA